MGKTSPAFLLLACMGLLFSCPDMAYSQNAPRMMGQGHPFTKADLPPGRLLNRLNQLPEPAQHRALDWLHRFSFPVEDLQSLAIDPEGSVFYICEFEAVPDGGESGGETEPEVSAASVPVSPFPAHLQFSSRPGAPNVIYLNFSGFVVTGTAWNDYVGRDPIPARVFSTDSDTSTFSDGEQAAIRRIWQRVAEDFAPFNVNVTTLEPVTWNNRTAHVLITRNTDVNGQANPASNAGGVAYVDVFNKTDYATYRPAWVYHNNLSEREDYIAEAASHEAGHNLGLSHDGKTDGSEYYGGHGSGDISWGPIMGTGYNRNVSQWSKGEYALANNTQDDLAILANKMGYRASDHGSTFGTASFLSITSNTLVRATTPQTDPGNTDPSNKGVIHQPTDADMWAFSSGAGPIRLSVHPWISPANTRGGNLDVRLTLYDANGNPIAQQSPPSETSATLETHVAEGVYYLKIEPVGTGSPLASSPSGYTVYGSLGQYFITGTVMDASGLVIPPQATLSSAPDVTQPGATTHSFQVTYSDNVAISAASIGPGDTYVTGPRGYSEAAELVSVNVGGDGTPRTATYRIPAPGGSWQTEDNGEYTVWMAAAAVFDVEGASVPPGPLGVFKASLPNILYAAYMDTHPGWTLEPQWAYGQPAGNLGDPSSGATGANVIGYNLNGRYEHPLSAKYATTPVIDCSGTDIVILRFQRWLGVGRNDTAAIQISVNQGAWTTIWTAPAPMADKAWQLSQFDLSQLAARAPNIRLRWTLSTAAPNQPSFGWNIDDVEILGVSDNLDTTPPDTSLFALDVSEAGGDFYSFSVTFTDADSGVDIASFGDGDLLVSGPQAYLGATVYTGTDFEENGSPRTAFHQIIPPGGTWSIDDNGTYTITLKDGAVADVAGNGVPESVLGSFTVKIAETAGPTYGSLSALIEPAKARGQGAGWRIGSDEEGLWRPSGEILHDIESGTPISLAFRDLPGWETPDPALATISADATNVVHAAYVALYTEEYPIPIWWLVDQGYTNDFEEASKGIGANGHKLWESYVAGLNPADAASLFRIEIAAPGASQAEWTLRWTAVTGRTYTVYRMEGPDQTGTPLPDAQDLPWPQDSHTVPLGDGTPQGFFHLGVRLAEGE